MIIATFFLTLGVASVIYGDMSNRRVPRASLDREWLGSSFWGVIGVSCYVVAAVVSSVGVFVMTSYGVDWNPDAGNGSILSFTPICAGALIIFAVPLCCAMSFGPHLRDSFVHDWSLWHWSVFTLPSPARDEYSLIPSSDNDPRLVPSSENQPSDDYSLVPDSPSCSS